MRLINTSTLELHEFYGDKIPHYAILSHRWEDEEVTFQDFRSGKGPSMAGWGKIKGCCAQALRDTWEYAEKWVDSCCIDKTSSAELSEAINSMFGWYHGAEICYAYLSDVCRFGNSEDALMSEIEKSLWFTRGWTLQELLAPDLVDFFDVNWQLLGTKSNMSQVITSITGIERGQLSHFDTEKTSIAQKMSWASSRKTTRIEDEAYCLMGIFNIFMPPLYGEGSHAFRRLQLEIIKQSNDDSIFAWGLKLGIYWHTDLLADSPHCFLGSGKLEKAFPDGRTLSSYTMTNKGLMLEVLMTSAIVKYGGKCTFIVLDCESASSEELDSRVLVRLTESPHIGSREDKYYARCDSNGLYLASEVPITSIERRVIYTKLDALSFQIMEPELLKITISASLRPPLQMFEYSWGIYGPGYEPGSIWELESPATWTAETEDSEHFEGSVRFVGADSLDLDLIITFNATAKIPWVSCFVNSKAHELSEVLAGGDHTDLDITIKGEGSYQLPEGRVIHLTYKRAMINGVYTMSMKIDIKEGPCGVYGDGMKIADHIHN